MSVQTHLFVMAYLPAVLILWRLLAKLPWAWAPRAFLRCAGLRA